jgi:hypothetical protein
MTSKMRENTLSCVLEIASKGYWNSKEQVVTDCLDIKSDCEVLVARFAEVIRVWSRLDVKLLFRLIGQRFSILR